MSSTVNLINGSIHKSDDELITVPLDCCSKPGLRCHGFRRELSWL